MKKIILSVAVATMALSTVASALEDVKVSGQAKLWYETSDKGDNSITDQASSSGEVVFKLAATGKQGNVGFGVTMYQTSTMGLETSVVSANRTLSSNLQGKGTPYVGEAYITAPLVASTIMKFGMQELDTPFAFTERWNATPNTFNAAVLVNNSVKNLTLIGAYVGQGSANDPTDQLNNTTGLRGPDGQADNAQWKSTGTPSIAFYNDAFAIAALYKTDAFGVNVWGYELPGVAQAAWFDASVKAGPVAVKAYVATMMPYADGADDTVAYALSLAGKAGSVSLFAAGSSVSEDGVLAIANTATGFKKTKLPTAGVYTDGLYVAVPGSTAFKVKASGNLGSTGLALQAVMNENSLDTMDAKDTTEIDLIITQKLGDFNLKGILMNRSFDDSATEKSTGANHVRVIASVNF